MKKSAFLVLAVLFAIPVFADDSEEYRQEIEKSEKLGIAISNFYAQCVAPEKKNSGDCKKMFIEEIMNQARIPCTALSPISGTIPAF